MLSENASRWCWPNGTWSNYSNYSLCRDLRLPAVEPGVETTTTLYFIGYSLSLFFLIVAVLIFHCTWVERSTLTRFEIRADRLMIVSAEECAETESRHSNFLYRINYQSIGERTTSWTHLGFSRVFLLYYINIIDEIEGYFMSLTVALKYSRSLKDSPIETEEHFIFPHFYFISIRILFTSFNLLA